MLRITVVFASSIVAWTSVFAQTINVPKTIKQATPGETLCSQVFGLPGLVQQEPHRKHSPDSIVSERMPDLS
jgi:hypothetical protein